MGRVLDEFAFRNPGTAAKYPWGEWFDGRIWELRRGVDFNIAAKSFRSGAISVASRRGLFLRTTLVDNDTVVIQAVPRGDK